MTSHNAGSPEPELVYITRTEYDRLRANQLPDGGEWATEYGHHGDYWARQRCRGCKFQRRVWYGPVEPITDETASEPI